MSKFLLISLFVCLPATASAFYDWQAEQGAGESSGDVRGLVRVYGLNTDYPENSIYYPKGSDSGLAEVTRLIAEGEINPDLGFEINLYQAHIPQSLTTTDPSRRDVERSARLEWSFSDEDFSHVAFDRLNFTTRWERLDVTLGRQAINLATTFYFTPNDFFAPFAAQNFFRVYKPGVDAIRVEFRMGELSQLSLIHVLGYAPDATTDTGWSRNVDSNRDSFIARASTVLHDNEWTLLGGHVEDVDVLGGAFQGELFDWLGIRAEGHVADSVFSDKYSELTVGIEHRWENSLDLRFEYFHHGLGASRVSDYLAVATATQSNYLARNYFSASAGYEFTPLLRGDLLIMVNLLDHSRLTSLYAVYSLSNEAELAVNLALPTGDKPFAANINSEFGFYPATLNVEVRSYF